MITIYHNTRCRKSREVLELLENSGKDYQVRDYVKEPLSEVEIENLLKKLEILPIQLIRKGEAIWKENYKNKDLSDKELISILSKNPKLMERPVVENEGQAVIGRPSSNIKKLL